MKEDILAPYRKTPLPPASNMPAAQGKTEYVAFAAKDKVACLRIRLANYLTHAIGYNILLVRSYDDDKGQTILLIYSVMRVKIEGRNLQELVNALNRGTADYIMEFDPDRWAVPTDPTAAFIESIEVEITEGNSLSADPEQ